ncbi:hypothetical protein B9Z55_012183 [Caenorhabditis nigoni]|nr:hypothetical protein B9Z55_012183 [Caenorhabditis nigoni]
MFIVWIGLLASLCLQTTVFGIKLTSNNKEEYLREINDFRRKYAKENKVPNMNKLFWDDALEAKAQINDWNGYMRTMRIQLPYKTSSEDQSDYLTYYPDIAKRMKMIDHYGMYPMGEVEMLTPGQQKIGCVPSEQEVPIGDNDKFSTTDTLCFLGPEGTGNSWDITQGEPGSVCDLEFENDDGLCSPVQTTTPEPKSLLPKPDKSE